MSLPNSTPTSFCLLMRCGMQLTRINSGILSDVDAIRTHGYSESSAALFVVTSEYNLKWQPGSTWRTEGISIFVFWGRRCPPCNGIRMLWWRALTWSYVVIRCIRWRESEFGIDVKSLFTIMFGGWEMTVWKPLSTRTCSSCGLK